MIAKLWILSELILKEKSGTQITTPGMYSNPSSLNAQKFHQRYSQGPIEFYRTIMYKYWIFIVYNQTIIIYVFNFNNVKNTGQYDPTAIEVGKETDTPSINAYECNV